MPEMTLLGWFHTVFGVGALLSGFYTLFTYKIISIINFSARIYLCLTLIVAASALGIYNQGSFGIAHLLTVLTLISIAGGFVMEKYKIFGLCLNTFKHSVIPVRSYFIWFLL